MEFLWYIAILDQDKAQAFHCSCVQGQVVWFSFDSGETTRHGSQACMAVHGRAFGVGTNLARSALPFSPVAHSGCAAQASATRFSGNSIRAPMGNSGECKPSAVESSIQRSSHQQVSRRGQEVCIFQGGPSPGSHCQFGRRRSGEVIFAAGNVPSNRLFFHLSINASPIARSSSSVRRSGSRLPKRT